MSAARRFDAPLVSVIVPTFNRRAMVVRAVESALAQSYRPIEILVLDDGSTDGTAEAIARLSGPIQYFSQPHCGVAAARNAAIRRSRGELIALLDSDDVWTPDKLTRCVDYLQQHPECDVVYTPTGSMDSGGQLLPARKVVCKEGWLLNDLFEENCIDDSAAVFHRRLWERFGGFDEWLPMSVGHNFWLRVSIVHRFGVIDEPLAVCTRSSDSLTGADPARTLRVRAEMLYRYYEEQGGRDRIIRWRARRALGRLGLRAGRMALQAGDTAYATRLFRGAVAYQPSWRSRFWFALADWRRRQSGLAEVAGPVLN